VHSWDILEAQAGKYIGKDKKWHHGKYLFTVDFAHPESNILDTDHSEIPHEHKCAHIIALNMIEKCKAVCCRVWDKVKAGWNWIVSRFNR
jgi:hypothetical protein